MNVETIKDAVHVRDRDKCANCGVADDKAVLDVHHIVPRGKGGSNRMSNLILLCRQCHDAAHDNGMAPVVEFSSTGKMTNAEFNLFHRLFEEVLDTSIWVEERNCWCVPKADMELFFGESKRDQDLDEQPALPAD